MFGKIDIKVCLCGEKEKYTMTSKELSEKMIDEKNTLRLYKKYVEKILHIEDWGTDQEWKEYLDITCEIVEILHNLNDYTLDTLYAELSDNQIYKKNLLPSIKHILNQINMYVVQYENELGICNVCGQEVYYLPLPGYYIMVS